MFDLEIYYTTGNSFGSENTCDMLELPTSSLDIVKENKKRILEHNELYNKRHSYSSDRKNLIFPDFYISEYKEGNYTTNIDGIKLLTDEGEHEMYSPFWIGYFESLNNVKIVVLEDY